ncbi:NAD(P)-binding protein [Lichtheimia hyalospora FSU 10163]|nr:NAD(P)-binding protein [Lichtheimia hyalospora FSU 10163]
MVAIVLNNKPRPRTTGYTFGYEIGENRVREPKENESLVKIQAGSFNHRDVWILKNQYPLPINTGSVLGADGVGTVEKIKGDGSIKQGQRVLINPGIGWDTDPLGPEDDYYILGLLPAIGTSGTFAEQVVVENKDLAPCPEHLTTAQAASLPLAGLTAYRAVFTRGNVKAGSNVLVTGIGGGVALYALQFSIAVGANVYVTSSKQDKIQHAKKEGAKGGVNYKDPKCFDDLLDQLDGAKIDTVIDGAGGSFYAGLPKVMRQGGILVNYGQTSDASGNTMTTQDKGGIVFTMVHVFYNLDLRGSTMGSRREFKEMVAFVNKHKIKPIVSKVWKGLTLENVDSAIDFMRNGYQQGKLVIEM